jgi:hypothetical protein
MFQLAVNSLGAVTVALCGVLLLRAYLRVRQRLLFWCGLCFTGLAVSNLLLIIDLHLLTSVDLYRFRLAAAAVSLALMVYGLIFKSEQS